MSKQETAAAILILIVVCVVARVIPHMPNFAPISATALFCGAYMSRRMSLAAPLIVMVISDYVLLYINPFGRVSFDTLYAPQSIWHSALPYVYLSFGVSALTGWLLRKERSAFLLLSAALFCSVQFFLITNAAVWIEGAYDRGLNGLWQSYVAGIPFYRGTLMGDVLYTFTFFGFYELLRRGRSAPAAASMPPGALGA